jgi:hypothetical protein
MPQWSAPPPFTSSEPSRFTTPASGTASAWVTLANTTFDSYLVIYTGASLTTLTKVVDNDECFSGRTWSTFSCVSFNVLPSTTYHVKVRWGVNCLGWAGAFRLMI